MAIYESFVRCMGACHLCGMILENTYGHLVTKHATIDNLYMLTILTIPMSWIAFKDECIVSYAIKKYQNADYVLGSAPENAQDIVELFPSKLAYDAFSEVGHFVRIWSILVVNQRTTEIPSHILVPTLVLYSAYLHDIACKTGYRMRIYPCLHIVLGGYLVACFFCVVLK